MKRELVMRASELFCIHPRDLVSDHRFGFLMPARFALYKALRLRGWSFLRIGALMGKDHSTIIHGVKRADYMMERDALYAEKVNELATANFYTPLTEKELTDCGL